MCDLMHGYVWIIHIVKKFINLVTKLTISVGSLSILTTAFSSILLANLFLAFSLLYFMFFLSTGDETAA